MLLSWTLGKNLGQQSLHLIEYDLHFLSSWTPKFLYLNFVLHLYELILCIFWALKIRFLNSEDLFALVWVSHSWALGFRISELDQLVILDCMCRILYWKLAYPKSAPWFVWWAFVIPGQWLHFSCNLVDINTEFLLFLFMSYWWSYSWAIVSVCMILYCILFHVRISNFRVIVDSISDHKWWYLTRACCQLPHWHHCHQCCQTNPCIYMGHLHSFWSKVVLFPGRTLSVVVTETLLLGPPRCVLGLISFFCSSLLCMICCISSYKTLTNHSIPHCHGNPCSWRRLYFVEARKVAEMLWAHFFSYSIPSRLSWEPTFQEVFPVLLSPFIIFLFNGWIAK
jgi:hypothetical protein